ncbi:MAG: permease [Actinomycetota bacterium]
MDLLGPPTDLAGWWSWLPGETVLGRWVKTFFHWRALVNTWLDNPGLQSWATIFVAICIQALPFLVLGVGLSALISAYVPASFFQRILPRNSAAAVPVAGLSGAVLPGCECGAVPIAASLVRSGVAPAAAMTFLLAAPAINPIVLISTAVAFPGQPGMVVARFAASLLVAVTMGWLWLRFGRGEWLRLPRRDHSPEDSRFSIFIDAARHDFLHAGGFLVVGGMIAATVNIVVPDQVFDAVADRPWLAVITLAFLAVIVAICSEADAFVAASFAGMSPVAQLAFMVVGPAVDVKLISLQAGTFSWRFAARFAPSTFVIAIAATVLVSFLVW